MDGYALTSSINKKAKTMFNTFDSSMQTLQSQLWYEYSAPSQNNNDVINLLLPKIPLSRFLQMTKHQISKNSQS